MPESIVVMTVVCFHPNILKLHTNNHLCHIGNMKKKDIGLGCTYLFMGYLLIFLLTHQPM
jgi:hypothetical protein